MGWDGEGCNYILFYTYSPYFLYCQWLAPWRAQRYLMNTCGTDNDCYRVVYVYVSYLHDNGSCNCMFRVMCIHTHAWDMISLTVVEMFLPLPQHILHALNINPAHSLSNMGVPTAIQTVNKDLTLCGWPLGLSESKKVLRGGVTSGLKERLGA